MSETRTLNEVLDAASEAEASGVPVNWKQLAYQIANAAVAQLQALQADSEPGEVKDDD